MSSVGRVTLAKSVIEAIPVYPMMTNLLSKGCTKKIQKLQRNFIWGDSELKRKHHAVGWDTITKAKSDGGLGMRDLNTMNQTCIMKLGCKIINVEDDLWCKVLRHKYKVDRIDGNLQAKSSDSNLWKAIAKTSNKLLDVSIWRIGDGHMIKPWEHSWFETRCNISKLNITIPRELNGARLCDLVNNDDTWK